MASSSAPLQEWLVIAPDFPNSMDKRLSVRQQHLGGLKEDPETFWLWGGTFSSFSSHSLRRRAVLEDCMRLLIGGIRPEFGRTLSFKLSAC